MSLRLSGDFYKRTLNQFEQYADEPLVFPILLGFLKKAAQSKVLLQGAKAVIGDDDAFRSFFNKTRTSLAPTQAQLLQEQETKIREKLKAEVEAEVRREAHQTPLAIELKLRKEYEEQALKAQERTQEIIKAAVDNIVSTNTEKEKVVKATIDNLIDAIAQRTDVDGIVQLQLESKAELKALREKYEADAKSDRKHRNVAYAISAISLAVGVAGVAVGLPGVVDKLMGKKPETKSNNSSLQVRLASSGQCLPSDIKVEISKDGTATLPSSGSVCLVVPDDAAPNSKREPASPFVLPYSDPCAPFTGKSMFDILNDGGTVRLFKEDGSSICLHMPKILPDVPAKEPDTTVHKEQGKTGPANRPAQTPKSKQHQRKRCP